jgi:hypothetical protein
MPDILFDEAPSLDRVYFQFRSREKKVISRLNEGHTNIEHILSDEIGLKNQ